MCGKCSGYFLLSWSLKALSWTWWASSWTPMSWFQLWRTSTKTSKSRSRMLMMIACEKWSMMMNWSLWVLSKCCRFHHRSGQLEFDEFVTLSARCSLKERKNKTQCRLCKRLAGPIIPFSNLGTPLVWSYLARSAVVWPMAFWSLGCSHQPFACILSNFDDWQKNRWTQCNPALDQWEGSLLQKGGRKILPSGFFPLRGFKRAKNFVFFGGTFPLRVFCGFPNLRELLY